MSQQNLPTINLYIDIQSDPIDRDFEYKIAFYDSADPEAPREQGGRIDVPRGGAVIYFHKVTSPQKPFDFHELVLHPMGTQANRLEMKWFVTPDWIALHDIGGVAQQFNYCLGMKLTSEGYKIYFDPQLINSGGG